MKIKWKILILCIVLMLTSLYSVQFYNINHKYPPMQHISYKKGQTVSYNGVDLKLLNTKFLDDSNFKKNNKELYENVYIENEEMKAIVVEIQVTNHNQHNVEANISDVWLQSNYWVNGYDLNGVIAINPEGVSLHPNLKPGETVTMKLPFTMIPAHFKEKDWDNIQNRKYDLVLSFYPIKRTLEIN